MITKRKEWYGVVYSSTVMIQWSDIDHQRTCEGGEQWEFNKGWVKADGDILWQNPVNKEAGSIPYSNVHKLRPQRPLKI